MKFRRTMIALLGIVILSICGYLLYIKLSVRADLSWISDFGYENNEVHKLTFNWTGERSCPEVPVSIGGKAYKLGFDETVTEMIRTA
jgi:hypothetical protein